MSWLNLLYKIKKSTEPNPDPSIKARANVHYWKLPVEENWHSKKYSRWLDIGIIVENINNDLEEIAIYLPFRTTTDSITDLSSFVREENFVSHLFKNRYGRILVKGSPSYHFLYKENSEEEDKNYYLYEICPASKETVDLVKGSLLKIKIESHPETFYEIKERVSESSEKDKKYNLYIHFRIKDVSDQGIGHTEDISNNLIQSAFSRSEMVDITFNDKVNIDHSDYQSITKEHSFLELSEIQFTFIGASEDETITGYPPINDFELLDPSIWAEYMSGMNPNEKKCISYHWKIQNSPSKVFFKTVYSSPSVKKFIKYSGYVVFLSFLASLLLETGKQGMTSIMNLFREKNDSTEKTTKYSPSDSILNEQRVSLQPYDK